MDILIGIDLETRPCITSMMMPYITCIQSKIQISNKSTFFMKRYKKRGTTFPRYDLVSKTPEPQVILDYLNILNCFISFYSTRTNNNKKFFV